MESDHDQWCVAAMPRPDEATFLGRTPLFEGLDAPALEAIAASATPRLVRAGQAVFVQEGAPTHLYLVAEGRVKIARVNRRGTSLTIRYMEPGEVLGCAAVVRRVPFSATATAVVDTRLLTWPAGRVGEMMEQHPRVATNALQVIGTRSEEMLHRLLEFATEPVERRIATALLRLSRQAGRPTSRGVEIGFPLSCKNIAEMAGSTLFTVSRTLCEWERQGLVLSGRQRVILRDQERLCEIGGGGKKLRGSRIKSLRTRLAR